MIYAGTLWKKFAKVNTLRKSFLKTFTQLQVQVRKYSQLFTSLKSINEGTLKREKKTFSRDQAYTLGEF